MINANAPNAYEKIKNMCIVIKEKLVYLNVVLSKILQNPLDVT